MNANEPYLRMDFSCPAPYQDFAIAELADFGFEGFEQHDQGFLAFIPERLVGETTRSEMDAALSNSDYVCERIAEERILPRNWNEEWEKSIRAQHIGPFFICPSWVDDPQPEGTIRLTVDPKMAFGTGNHETTRLIMKLLPNWVSEHDTVLDVGTGTGILAIAALKLGAASAFGFDIDEWSHANARENALRNDVDSEFAIALGSFETVPANAVYDLVIANVNRGILIDMAADLVRSVAPGGKLILSGLLHHEDGHILSVPEFQSLRYEGTERENDWIAMKFSRE